MLNLTVFNTKVTTWHSKKTPKAAKRSNDYPKKNNTTHTKPTVCEKKSPSHIKNSLLAIYANNLNNTTFNIIVILTFT